MSTDTTHREHDLVSGNGRIELLASEDLSGSNYPVSGVLLGENEVTTGLSGTKSRWPASVLRDAVDRDLFAGVKFVKGVAGLGHRDIDEQAAPDTIVGGIDSTSYSSGRGITFQGSLVDERMAALVNAGLIEPSVDVYRELSDTPDADGTHSVEHLVAARRVTLLDEGASAAARIDLNSAAAEALAELPQSEDLTASDSDREQLANSAMTVADVRKASQRDLSGPDYLASEYGIDLTGTPTEASLREQLVAAKNTGGGD